MPSEVSYIRAAHVRVLPEELDGPALYLPMARMVVALRPEVDEAGNGRYTIFEPGQRPRVRACSHDWRLSDYAADAAGSAAGPVRTLQFITRPMSGLPCPQLTLTLTTAAPDALAVPFDLRVFALNVVTASVTNQATMAALPDILASGAPIPRLLTLPQGTPQAVLDAAGRRHVDFRGPLVELEWAVLHYAELGGDVEDATATRPDALRALRGDVPSLLGRERRLRPTFQPPAFECRPAYIFEDSVAIQDSLQFTLDRGSGPYGRQRFQYTLFAWHSWPRNLLAEPGWTLSDLAVFAGASHDESLRSMHVLQSPMPGIATPQMVATSVDVVDPWRIIPVDLRPIGGDVFCPPLSPDMPAEEVYARIRPFVTTNVAVQLRVEGHGPVYLQDQTGAVYDTLPDTLDNVDWLAVRPLHRVMPTSPLPAGTTTTTTGVVAGPVRVLVALVTGAQTLRTLPVELEAFDSVVALTRLVSAVARSRTLPPGGYVQQLAAYPSQDPDGVQSIPFVLASGRTGLVAVVIDITTCGQGIYSVEVSENTWAEDLLKPNQRARELTYLVNGIPMQGIRRPLRTGDYLQLVPNTCRGTLTISPSTVWMRRIRQLRLWALPVAFPPLTHGQGGMPTDLAEHAARAFLRYYREVEAGRLQTFGSFGPGRVAIWVLSAWNPPMLFAAVCPVTPSLAESEQALRSSGVIAEDAVLIEGERPISLTDSVVIQVGPADPYRTLLLPVPGDPEFFMVTAINPLAPIEPTLHVLPRLPYTVVFPPAEVRDGAVFRVRVPAGAVSARARVRPRPESTGSATSSLSLLQADLRLSRKSAAPEDDAELRVTNLPPPHKPAETSTVPCSVPTPHGRRRIFAPEPQHTQPEAATSGNACLGASIIGRAPDDRAVIRQLCLDELLPSAPQTQPALAFPLPDGLERDAFEPFALDTLQCEVPIGLRLVPSARAFLAALPAAPQGHPEALMMFVDGSFRDGCSSWSVAVLGLFQTTWHWMGFRAGRVPDECSGVSVYEAELWAQLMALCTAAQADLPTAVLFDSQSAALVAHGATAELAAHPLQATVASVACYVRCGRHPLRYRHIPSHQGNPGNELADGLAKHFLGLDVAADRLSQQIKPDVLGCHFSWLWLRRVAGTQAQWPALDQHGCSLPCTTVSAPVPAACPQHTYVPRPEQGAARKPMRVKALFLTYNTLSCKTSLQRHCLHRFMQSQDAAVLALQETRQVTPPVTVVEGVIRVASAPVDGQMGCQLWLRSSGVLAFDRHRLSILCAEPRMLIVMTQTSVGPLVFVVAHAPTSTAPAGEKEAWWACLNNRRLRGLPPKATPVICCDANARYAWRQGQEHPANDNAAQLDKVADAFEMYRTRSYSPAGDLVVTWTSPQGAPACLDYILFPRVWQAHVDTVPGLVLLDEHAGIDHQVLGARLDVQLDVATRAAPCLDREAMLTPEGRTAVAQLFANAPICPWSANSDEHLRGLHEHLLHGARALFPGARHGPRRPVLSDGTWQLLRVKRWARRVYRRRQRLFRRQCLHAVFGGWREATRVFDAGLPETSLLRAHDYRVAHYIRFMQQLGVSLRAATLADEAAFARDHLTRARKAGPKAMAAAIRAVLKHGRRYRRPQPAPTLRTENGDLVHDEADIKALFGRHFAKSERATPCSFADMACPRPERAPTCLVVDALPTVADLSSAFAGMRCGKAPGPTLLPAELFKAAPMEAALSVMPVLLKSQARQCFPLLWRGVHSIALLKPLKDPQKVDSHRAIALMATTGKAVAKACRPVLARNFESITQASVGGSRKDVPIELPSLMVQAFLGHLHRHRLNGAVLFLDGVAAFPSTDRTLLFDLTEDELHAKLVEAQVEPAVADRYKAAFRGRGALDRAGVPADVIAFLRASLRGTWFSVDENSAQAYATTCGTLPGAPNADISFQYAAQASLAALERHLADEGISASLVAPSGDHVDAPPATWLDDIALMVASPSAQQLPHAVARAASLAAQYLRILGVGTNFAPGKTETVMHACGPGSQQVRRRCMVGDDLQPTPGIGVSIPGHPTVQLRCVAQYAHLGTLRATDAKSVEDVTKRIAHAREALHPVRYYGILRGCVVQGRDCLVKPAADKARLHERAAVAGVCYSAVPVIKPTDGACECQICGSCFSTAAARAAHMAKVHDVRSQASYAVGSSCQVCCKQYWSTARLRQHLRTSVRCARSFAGADLDTEPEVHEDPCVRAPPTVMFGPRPWWALLVPQLPSPIPSAEISWPTNHSGSTCFLPILERFLRLVESHGSEEAAQILQEVVFSDEYGRLAQRLAPALSDSSREHQYACT
ncbi:unnamed protein product, partial [Symbiodinium sp. CCMP2456]